MYLTDCLVTGYVCAHHDGRVTLVPGLATGEPYLHMFSDPAAISADAPMAGLLKTTTG